MSQASPPALTVRTDESQRTFAPGVDVVIGRDLRADVRVAHPLVSRAHIVLRFDQGRSQWQAIDNGSLNGMFVGNERVSSLDVRDGQAINIGSADGPQLTFEVGRHVGAVGKPPQTTSVALQPPPGVLRQAVDQARSRPQPYPPIGAQPPRGYPPPPPSGPQVRPPSGPQGRPPTGPPPGRPPSAPQYVPPPQQRAPETEMAPRQRPLTRGMKILGPRPVAGTTIGRATDNNIVIADVLASRHHATLVQTGAGVEIHDNKSINGTFVNGNRVDRALLRDGDVVTIGNVDMVFQNGTLVRRTETEAATRTGGLEVSGITLEIENRRILLNNISFSARPGTLTAVIGPSGAGKSTLSKVIVGTTNQTLGKVSFEGHDIHAQYSALRSRIGMVPQDDVVHRQLTVDQALSYAAELRLPPDTTKQDRSQVVAQVLEELEMTKHRYTRVDKLSGGQRKRASVAMELLTGPSLLILDEPTSGLDPALDRNVMKMLRGLADAGRVVVVVTHSLSYLDYCDQVVLLAPGGMTAFSGPPSDIGRRLGTTNWADIFQRAADDPDGVHAEYLKWATPPSAAPETATPADLGKPVHTSLVRQFSTVARRQLRLIVSDRGYFIFLMLLPFIMGSLALSVPRNKGQSSGFDQPPLPKVDPATGATILADAPNAPGQILVLLNVGAIFIGTALTIRDLIGERPIFKREQAVGLSTTAYLLAKMFVYTMIALFQAAIVVAITIVVGKNAPTRGAVMLGNGSLELYVDIAATCVTAAMVGLALSAIAKSNEQIMPLLVVAIMSQLVFSGGMIPVTGTGPLDWMSWATPARWGFATSAATVDLTELVKPPTVPNDTLWHHAPKTWWILDMAMLAVLSVIYAGFVRWKIRLKVGAND